MGSGTTALAAKNLDRNFIGIDLSPEYCKMAEDRIVASSKAKIKPLFADMPTIAPFK